MPERSEPDLIEDILDGEAGLYEYFIRKYNQRLFRTGMSILNNDNEVEDAMQTSYIKAYEHLRDFKNRSSFGTWVTRIMINECLLQKKNKQRLKIVGGNHPEKISHMDTPAKSLINKELAAVLENAIAGLPEKYRLVFLLREVEDLSVKETADVLALEESNIKVRLNRAKTMLRENLSGYVKENIYSFHFTRCDRIVSRVFNALQIDNPIHLI
ncbi:MAG TPA: sigma-70 family RNA polymerase sigma factor [Puia sp.]